MNRAAAADMARHLGALRNELPPTDRPWRTLAVAIDAKTGIGMSHEQVRKLHTGQVDPWKATPEHLWALARFYDSTLPRDVTIEDLGENAAQRLSGLREMAQNWKDLSMGPDGTPRRRSGESFTQLVLVATDPPAVDPHDEPVAARTDRAA